MLDDTLDAGTAAILSEELSVNMFGCSRLCAQIQRTKYSICLKVAVVGSGSVKRFAPHNGRFPLAIVRPFGLICCGSDSVIDDPLSTFGRLRSGTGGRWRCSDDRPAAAGVGADIGSGMFPAVEAISETVTTTWLLDVGIGRGR